jgi:hypothetical protein
VPAIYATTKVKPTPLGQAALILEKQPCGIVYHVEGGAVGAEVVGSRATPGSFVKKNIGKPHYEDFKLRFGFAMARPVFDWIAGTWKLEGKVQSGSLVACDQNLEAKAERQFKNALITEVTIPKLDASSKDAVWLGLSFAPEAVRFQAASGKASGGDPKHPEKLLLASSFKLAIDGLDCSKVRKIDSMSVRQRTIQDGIVGKEREYELHPGGLEFPNLKVTFSEVAAEPWMKWLEDFVIQGNCEENHHKNGTLELLAPDKGPKLAAIKFFGLGICKLSHSAPAEGDSEQMLFTAEMYCERMELEPAT